MVTGSPNGPVLVTGTGGPAGVAVVRALVRAGEDVVAADASADAVGLRLGHHRAVLPRGDDPDFAEAVAEAARRTGARALVATVAEELVALDGAAERLDRAGLAHWLPDPAAVEACTDKWRFHLVTTAAGVAVPPTGLGSADGVPGPWIVKPRHGRGSRDIVAVDDPADLDHALAQVPEPMVQHRLAGREFTVDALVDRDGRLAAAVPRWRDETKAGISVRGETFADPALGAGVGVLLGAVGLTGPANVQGFMEPGAATAMFTEVNPRFSGGLPLSLAAGCDLVGEYLGAVRGRELDPGRLGFTPGVRMYRYYEEIFEGP
jgi:carbamoyl-phosphate synthase large subunit